MSFIAKRKLRHIRVGIWFTKEIELSPSGFIRDVKLKKIGIILDIYHKSKASQYTKNFLYTKYYAQGFYQK